MKNYKLVTMLMLIGLSLSSRAQSLADIEDLKVFSDTNYCQGCDLSGAKIYEDHDNGSLLNSYAIKTEFTGALYKMDFSGSIMTYSKFLGKFFNALRIQEATFDKVNLSYSNFINTDLSGANFSDVNLSYSELERANFSGVDFTNANLNNVTINNSILIGALLSEEQLKQVKSITCTVMPNGELYSNGC
ncbi:pentapeptide repeat-containing protein [Legionella quinlivanii]|uniref:pentapeptide repeat-containing protein n=1 Tax=Legionella quinlivanii TaxID=45073 RepID=UPI002244938A|nr:pentapeptide repeat-containing protein [Legionella quinlivanii]MCW8451792.1 pentapeptide repeat-containing protein [Legionella quinlivanii]